MSSSAADSWFDHLREGLREFDLERSSGSPGGPSSGGDPLPDIPRYAIGERIGEGSAAVVYRGFDRELGRSVAIKILRESGATRRLGRDRFLREAKTAAGLSHPHLVAVHDVGEAGGRLFLVLELVDGTSLADRLGDPALGLSEKLRILEKSALGVAAAHERGVIHRDLKPANILVGRTGEPKVGDFGLALGAGSDSRLTQLDLPVGTPAYMAPEQVRGSDPLTAAADVYALGAILYEILTGRPPHLAPTLPELYQEILRGDPVPPRNRDLKIPRDLEAICLKSLAKDPADRYPEAAAFARELERHRTGEPVGARGPSVLVRARHFLGRHRAALPLACAALLLGIGGTSVALEHRSTLHQAELLHAALERGFDQAAQRLGDRYKALQSVRLVAALQAVADPGGDATRPPEIGEVLDYELRKLRLEPELLLLVSARGQTVYARGPLQLLETLEKQCKSSGRSLVTDGERLWLLLGSPVIDPVPERPEPLLGFRLVGMPVESSWLEPSLGPGGGAVYWSAPAGPLQGGTFPPSEILPRDGHLKVRGRDYLDLPQALAGTSPPIQEHLLMPASGSRTWIMILVSLAAVGLLALAFWGPGPFRRSRPSSPGPR